jgi:hypothetical protein
MPVSASKSSIPFAGTVTDSLELMRKVWGMSGLPTIPSPASMAQFAQSLPQSLPSMIAPTLDVGELDKRIADLRAVEQWLGLNMSMLRTTIQSLEVQRNTIATLKSFGGTMLAAVPGATARTGAEPTTFGTTKFGTSVAPPSPAPAAPAATLSRARRGTRKGAAKTAAPVMPLNPAAWWSALQDQFAKVSAAAAVPAAAAPKKTAARKRAARKTG